MENDLKALGQSASNRKLYQFDRPDSQVLERFKNPHKSTEGHGVPTSNMVIHIEAPEFTSLCPVTGQPDFAKIFIDYLPHNWCVESKSLKLYLMGFRNHGEFHEACIHRILSDLVALLDPQMMEVRGEFFPRGGISITPQAFYCTEEGFDNAAQS